MFKLGDLKVANKAKKSMKTLSKQQEQQAALLKKKKKEQQLDVVLKIKIKKHYLSLYLKS